MVDTRVSSSRARSGDKYGLAGDDGRPSAPWPASPQPAATLEVRSIPAAGRRRQQRQSQLGGAAKPPKGSAPHKDPTRAGLCSIRISS